MRDSPSGPEKRRVGGLGTSGTKAKGSSTRKTVRQRRWRRRRRMANEDEHKNKNKEKGTDEKKKNSVRQGEAVVPITPQMIRLAVKELHVRRVFVSSALIAIHLQQRYPIESDPETLKKELEDKLDDAVSVGLVTKCGPDAYCLPTLRHQANTLKTDFTRFWEKYHKRVMPIRNRINRADNSKKKLKRVLQRDSTE